MLFGRLMGWVFLITAFFTVSAEAVASLGAGSYVGIATSDVLTIITGMTPSYSSTWISPLLLCPAWTTMGLIGVLLIFSCRKKKFKSAFSAR